VRNRQIDRRLLAKWWQHRHACSLLAQGKGGGGLGVWRQRLHWYRQGSVAMPRRLQASCYARFAQVVTEEALVARSEQFDEAIHGGDRAAMVAFCDAKAAAASGDEAESWAFLRVLFEADSRRCGCPLRCRSSKAQFTVG
jgi:hypothetical protein